MPITTERRDGTDDTDAAGWRAARRNARCTTSRRGGHAADQPDPVPAATSDVIHDPLGPGDRKDPQSTARFASPRSKDDHRDLHC
jgi:hypothetical protein